MEEERQKIVARMPAPISLVARRYAGSLFELATEAGCVEAIGRVLSVLSLFLDKNSDFRYFVSSPAFSKQNHLKAVEFFVNQAGLNGIGASGLIGNFLQVVASSGRLSILSVMIKAFHDLAADLRGEVFAEVVSAYALSDDQQKELKTVLDDAFGKDIVFQVDVDTSILGGLIVRIGSFQVDVSLRTKLSSLKLALKEGNSWISNRRKFPKS
ncbi:MAG: F-type H+-transporting ATPase subunit delta [Candidatus Tokpelaia sp. JSC085]|nr:MAG: F-type H+-transporting ATPase subunit delta [Candidatus Tokpelaia sp. JSC085]